MNNRVTHELQYFYDSASGAIMFLGCAFVSSFLTNKYCIALHLFIRLFVRPLSNL